MGQPLGPVATTDSYPGPSAGSAAGSAIQLASGIVERLDIWVSGNPVYYSLAMVMDGVTRFQGGGGWTPEQYLPCPSGQTIFVSIDRRCAGIRFRSAVAGKSATVVAELIAATELPDSASAG